MLLVMIYSPEAGPIKELQHKLLLDEYLINAVVQDFKIKIFSTSAEPKLHYNGTPAREKRDHSHQTGLP